MMFAPKYTVWHCGYLKGEQEMSDTPRTDAAIISAWEWGEGGIERSIGFTTVPVDFARTLEKENAALRKDAEKYRKIAELIGTIFVHGNFKAETSNERELEKLLREVGCFWETLAEFDAAKEEGK